MKIKSAAEELKKHRVGLFGRPITRFEAGALKRAEKEEIKKIREQQKLLK